MPRKRDLEKVRGYCRAYYARNREAMKARTKLIRRGLLEQARSIALEAKKGGCIDCGEDDPIVLDFDHRDRKLKVMDLARAIHSSWSAERIRAEIAKCDVRCANCHRRRTYAQRLAGEFKSLV